MYYKSGIYKTIYGNACEYLKGADHAYDMDLKETIHLELVDFNQFIRKYGFWEEATL